MYKRALEAGILEGTARRMREELRKYKQHYQATEAAKTLAGAATRY